MRKFFAFVITLVIMFVATSAIGQPVNPEVTVKDIPWWMLPLLLGGMCIIAYVVGVIYYVTDCMITYPPPIPKEEKKENEKGEKSPALVLLVLALVATSAIGQSVNPSAPVPTYVVQSGDTGWELARAYYDDPKLWGLIVNLNPALKEPGRVFEKEGKIILLLKPGEQLFGLDKLQVDPPKAVSIERLVSPAPVNVSAPWPTPAPVVVEDTTKSTMPWWLWWLFLCACFLFGVLATGYFLSFRDTRKKETEKERELSQDPVSSGPAVVPDGIRPEETIRLESYFQDQASSQSHSINPPVRISPIEEGMIYGSGMVGYADRARRRRIDPPQPGYRARFRFPDGSERVLMSLMACMNPCSWGEGLSGFNFAPGRIVVPAPVVTPIPVSVTPTQVTTPSTDHPEDGVVRFELRRATDGQPAMVRMTGVDEFGDNTIELKRGVVILRFTPRSN